MKVTWEVEDGYTGGARPQTTEIPDDEIASCDSLEDAMEMVHDYIQEDFENQVSAGLRRGDEVEAEVRKLLFSRPEGED